MYQKKRRKTPPFKSHSERLDMFLQEHGLEPYREERGCSYYHPSRKLDSLLEKYEIIYFCIPNKL